MANKWRDEVDEENLNLVQMVISDSIIANNVTIEVLSDDEGSAPVSAIIENGRVTKLTGGDINGIEVTILLNENIFDHLPQDLKVLAIEEAIHGIHRNAKDKVSKDTEGSFTSYLGFLQKVGTDKFVIYKEAISSAKRALDEGNIPDKRQIKMDFKAKMNDIIDKDDNIDSVSIKVKDTEIKFEGSDDN